MLARLVAAPELAGWTLPPRPGEVVGRFEIVREVGRGGFGVVYEAHDRQLSRAVAFKAIQSSTETAAGARAVAEAEAAARLAHPNIVHLYDLGHCDRGAWLIMELLRGRSLAERLAEGPLPLREAVRVAVELSRGVAHAHAQGVVHRDLKPSNAFLCADGQVKILDFGLALVFGRASASGGTPVYMAPEQAAGGPGNERSDVYSLGLVFRELLTGRPPGHMEHAPGAGAAHPGAGGAPLRGAPAALSKLLARMTAPDPAARPANGAEVHAALQHVQRSMEPRRLLWAGWGLAAAALLLAMGFALWYRPLPPGRLLAALADTDNQSGDPELDGLTDLLRAGLESSGRLSLMARSQLVNAIEASGAGVPGRIGEREARAAAEGARAQLLYLPAVRRAGPGYELSVSVVDLARGETRLALTRLAPAMSSVPPMLDELVRGLREALGEAPGAAPRAQGQLADLAPADPEALRHHAEGNRLASEGRFDEAQAAYRRAIDLDPTFLLPRVGLESLLGYRGVLRFRARFSANQRAWHLENREILSGHLDPLQLVPVERPLTGVEPEDGAEPGVRGERHAELGRLRRPLRHRVAGVAVAARERQRRVAADGVTARGHLRGIDEAAPWTTGRPGGFEQPVEEEGHVPRAVPHHLGVGHRPEPDEVPVARVGQGRHHDAVRGQPGAQERVEGSVVGPPAREDEQRERALAGGGQVPVSPLDPVSLHLRRGRELAGRVDRVERVDGLGRGGRHEAGVDRVPEVHRQGAGAAGVVGPRHVDEGEEGEADRVVAWSSRVSPKGSGRVHRGHRLHLGRPVVLAAHQAHRGQQQPDRENTRLHGSPLRGSTARRTRHGRHRNARRLALAWVSGLGSESAPGVTAPARRPGQVSSPRSRSRAPIRSLSRSKRLRSAAALGAASPSRNTSSISGQLSRSSSRSASRWRSSSVSSARTASRPVASRSRSIADVLVRWATNLAIPSVEKIWARLRQGSSRTLRAALTATPKHQILRRERSR